MGKSTAEKIRPQTTMIPVVTMEEIPVVSEEQRAAFIASLKEAEAEYAQGKYIELEAGEIEPWLNGMVDEARARKKHGV